MTSRGPSFAALEDFIRPMIGLAAWGVKPGHGSFLTFEFGEPIEDGARGSRAGRGRWHLWIYCCHWRAARDGSQLASSEDKRALVANAAGALDGRRLVDLVLDPDRGRSSFAFDLGLTLETWPYGDDPTDEQWMILTENEGFAYRADGLYSRGPSNVPMPLVRWMPLS